MVRSILRPLLVAAPLAILAGCAGAGGHAPATTAQTAKGAALVDAKGMTLYTFDKDANGKSACNGGCAKNWPPLMAMSGAAAPAGYSVITRDDGSKQWAYKGKPLYGWVKDQKAGDTTGDGFRGVWHIATP